MREQSGTNVVVAVGLVLLVVGGIGFVYGQLSLQQQTTDDGGGFLDVTASDGGGDDAQVQLPRLVRVLGLVVGVVGAVVAIVGGLG